MFRQGRSNRSRSRSLPRTHLLSAPCTYPLKLLSTGVGRGRAWSRSPGCFRVEVISFEVTTEFRRVLQAVGIVISGATAILSSARVMRLVERSSDESISDRNERPGDIGVLVVCCGIIDASQSDATWAREGEVGNSRRWRADLRCTHVNVVPSRFCADLH